LKSLPLKGSKVIYFVIMTMLLYTILLNLILALN